MHYFLVLILPMLGVLQVDDARPRRDLAVVAHTIEQCAVERHRVTASGEILLAWHLRQGPRAWEYPVVMSECQPVAP